MLVGAGDIANCNAPGDEATANLLDNIAGTIFTIAAVVTIKATNLNGSMYVDDVVFRLQ